MNFSIVIFSFNRPNILKQCLESINNQININEYDIFLYQDNFKNKFSNINYSTPTIINSCINIFNNIFPNGNVSLSDKNIGVGLNHFRGYEDMFIKKKYKYSIFIDDDVVFLNKNAINTLLKMCIDTEKYTDVMGSDFLTTPFTYLSQNNKILLMDTYKYHIDFKSFCCSQYKFNLIYNLYKNKVNQFFNNVDYKLRWKKKDDKGITCENKIKKFFLENNKNITYYSQDWVRDVCFRHFNMNKKAILNINISKNIGINGVHSNNNTYTLEGFNNIKYIDKCIYIEEIININQNELKIHNNPKENTFSFTFGNNQNKQYLVNKLKNRFK